MFYRRDAVRVSLAYRYHNPNWDLARNRAVYGEDHNVEGIGANMTIWLEVAGEPMNDLLIPEKSLAGTLAQLKAALDHRCLFEVEPWFFARIPTLENIALFLTEKIDRPWHSLTIEESENWRVQLFSQSSEALLTAISYDGFVKTEVSVGGLIDPESGLVAPRGLINRRYPNVVFFRIENPQRTAFEQQFGHNF